MSNISLHISSQATVRFTRDVLKFPLVFTRWEGMELMNFSPLVYAFEAENIAITGNVDKILMKLIIYSALRLMQQFVQAMGYLTEMETARTGGPGKMLQEVSVGQTQHKTKRMIKILFCK